MKAGNAQDPTQRLAQQRPLLVLAGELRATFASSTLVLTPGAVIDLTQLPRLSHAEAHGNVALTLALWDDANFAAALGAAPQLQTPLLIHANHLLRQLVPA